MAKIVLTRDNGERGGFFCFAGGAAGEVIDGWG